MELRERLRKYLYLIIWPALALIIFIYAKQMIAGGDLTKTGDWLINYEGGVVRRGLIGELLIKLADLGLSFKWLIFTIQTCFYLAIFYLVQTIYVMREREKEWYLFLLSPAFLLYPLYDTAGSYKKEIIVFTSFLILARGYARQSITAVTILGSLSLYLIATYSHELAGLVLPFFMYTILKAFQLNLITRRLAIVSIVCFVATAFSSELFALYFHGGRIIAEKICHSVVSRGFSRAICAEEGAIHWFWYDKKYAFSRVLYCWPTYKLLYPPLMVLALIPIFTTNWFKKINSILLMTIGFIALLPLFFFAFDWGRWIYVYIFFVFTLILAESVWQDVKIRYVSTWIMILYLSTWSIQSCCETKFRHGLIGQILSKTLKIVREF